jgi:hypothetical protein
VQPGSQEILNTPAESVKPLLVRQVLRRFGAVRLRAFGASMWPAIQPGDLLDVQRVTPARLTPGDVVLFERNGRLFVHRVVWRRGRVMQTRGDAHWRADPPLTADDLLGMVTVVSREGIASAPPPPAGRAAAMRAVLGSWRRRPVLGLFQGATLTRFVRSAVLDVVRLDFVNTARAKGLSERRTVVKHVIRNALIPVVTLVALQIPAIFTGAVITEQIFRIPGIGSLLIASILANDTPVIMAITFVFSCLVVLFNLVADLLYGWLDPRISYR